MGGLRQLLERYKRKHAHEHNFETLQAFDDFPLPDGMHTHIILLACKCRIVRAFPESNLQLADAETIEQLRNALTNQNWTLEFPTRLH